MAAAPALRPAGVLTFRCLSRLLTYPQEDLRAAVPRIARVLEVEGLLGEAATAGVNRLLTDLATADLLDLQERYVELFDRQRSLSLHLFEHVYAESRDRGPAMVELKRAYEAAGLEITANELPDFLPLYLEYLSVLPLDEARRRLRDPLAVIGALGRRLRHRDEGYAAVFAAIEDLAGAPADEEAVAALLGEGGPAEEDAQTLDEAWAEEPVGFMGGACAARHQPRVPGRE